MATHSKPTKRAKNRNDEPRSFSASSTSNHTPQAARRGARYFGSSTSQRPKRRVPVASSSSALGEDRGEEDPERQLGKFLRLEAQRPDVDPQAGAVHVLADMRGKGEQQKDDADQCQ